MPIWDNGMITPSDKAAGSAEAQIEHLEAALKELQKQNAESAKQAKRANIVGFAAIVVNAAVLVISVLALFLK